MSKLTNENFYKYTASNEIVVNGIVKYQQAMRHIIDMYAAEGKFGVEATIEACMIFSVKPFNWIVNGITRHSKKGDGSNRVLKEFWKWIPKHPESELDNLLRVEAEEMTRMTRLERSTFVSRREVMEDQGKFGDLYLINKTAAKAIAHMMHEFGIPLEGMVATYSLMQARPKPSEQDEDYIRDITQPGDNRIIYMNQLDSFVSKIEMLKRKPSLLRIFDLPRLPDSQDPSFFASELQELSDISQSSQKEAAEQTFLEQSESSEGGVNVPLSGGMKKKKGSPTK